MRGHFKTKRLRLCFLGLPYNFVNTTAKFSGIRNFTTVDKIFLKSFEELF